MFVVRVEQNKKLPKLPFRRRRIGDTTDIQLHDRAQRSYYNATDDSVTPIRPYTTYILGYIAFISPQLVAPEQIAQEFFEYSQVPRILNDNYRFGHFALSVVFHLIVFICDWCST